MKYECEIIQDLIPLVKDGIASEKSEVAVMSHIKECAACKEVHGTDTQFAMPPMKTSESEEISDVTHYRNRIKKRRKFIIAIAALFTLVLVIGTVFATILLVKFLAGESYTTRSIADYGNYSGHIEAEQAGFFSLLEIFPNTIPRTANVQDYYYYCNNGLLDNSYQLFLLCSYGESDFILEKERLETLELTFRGEVHKPVITDTGFNYRAVVTIFGDQNSYEYALIDDETRTIAYVFAQSMGINKSVVPSKYLPQGFQPPKEALNGLGSFNIYRFKLDDGMFGETYVIPGIDNIS